MKRIVLLSVLCMLAIALSAQTEHVKFIEIPINGTITKFHQKIVAKGAKYENGVKLTNSRAYSYKYYGDKARLIVNYDPSTNNVYQVGVLIPCKSVKEVLSKFKKHNAILNEHYLFYEDISSDGNYSFLMLSSNGKEPIGLVSTSVLDNDLDYNNPYDFVVDYLDLKNAQSREKRLSNEL